jgi:hypothetical protein|tara:strand:+ start:14 stop:220 length:207 start_codon:yes stop_codon:yes gene_type:complete
VEDGARFVIDQRRKDVVMGEIALDDPTSGDVGVGDLDDHNVIRPVSLETLNEQSPEKACSARHNYSHI